MNNDSLRGLFYITRGSYTPMKKSGDEINIQCYDPKGDSEEWYRVLDNITHTCIFSGKDYEKALNTIYNYIIKYKSRKNFFRELSRNTNVDYYGVHYLGKKPLTPEQKEKRSVGKTRTSSKMRDLEKRIYEAYGKHYIEDIERVEKEAYDFLKNDTPLNKSKKLMKHNKILRKTPDNTHIKRQEETPVKKNTLLKVGIIKPIKKLNKVLSI